MKKKSSKKQDKKPKKKKKKSLPNTKKKGKNEASQVEPTPDIKSDDEVKKKAKAPVITIDKNGNILKNGQPVEVGEDTRGYEKNRDGVPRKR